MKLLSREFTLMEKILILVLCLALVGLAYYQFVDKPVRKAIAAAQAEQQSLDREYTTLQSKLTTMRKMQKEIDTIMASSSATEMGSYNNSKEELRLLNDILKQSLRYTINISNVTRTGDQIRRNFSVSFNVKDYDSVRRMLSQLTDTHLRVLISDLSCSASGKETLNKGQVSVRLTATFYETMVGGTPDAGLPSSETKAK